MSAGAVCPGPEDRSWHDAYLRHHLRLAGLRDSEGPPLTLLDRPGAAEVHEAMQRLRTGARLIAVQPSDGFLRGLGGAPGRPAGDPAAPADLRPAAGDPAAPADLRPAAGDAAAYADLRPAAGGGGALRTFHEYRVGAAGSDAVVVDARGRAAWWWQPTAFGRLLVVGTDLAADLRRHRQGDPAAVRRPATDPLWGIAGERPVYLFEAQRRGLAAHERCADHWAMLLAREVARAWQRPLSPVLPGGAPGAVVLTGDDDQAYLDAYRRQIALLEGAPTTYFLHPRTRHTPQTLRGMLGDRRYDLGLHPDALDRPEAYPALFARQAAWFRGLTGRPARAVRNHGYLNDGYWGHLPCWLEAGVWISANVPGVDGTVLNGSLVPARVLHDGRLTDHWSVVTAFGDGLVVSMGMNAEAAAGRIEGAATAMLADGLPGVLVLNLHPQNVEVARSLHEAALALASRGFLLWNLRDCLSWFRALDGSDPDSAEEAPPARPSLFRRLSLSPLRRRGATRRATACRP